MTHTQKVVLITGASSGMGKDMALVLTEEGHTVYGAARRVEKWKILLVQVAVRLKWM